MSSCSEYFYRFTTNWVLRLLHQSSAKRDSQDASDRTRCSHGDQHSCLPVSSFRLPTQPLPCSLHQPGSLSVCECSKLDWVPSVDHYFSWPLLVLPCSSVMPNSCTSQRGLQFQQYPYARCSVSSERWISVPLSFQRPQRWHWCHCQDHYSHSRMKGSFPSGLPPHVWADPDIFPDHQSSFSHYRCWARAPSHLHITSHYPDAPLPHSARDAFSHSGVPHCQQEENWVRSSVYQFRWPSGQAVQSECFHHSRGHWSPSSSPSSQLSMHQSSSWVGR